MLEVSTSPVWAENFFIQNINEVWLKWKNQLFHEISDFIPTKANIKTATGTRMRRGLPKSLGPHTGEKSSLHARSALQKNGMSG